ncbi:MAG: 2-amino-4-hydroxy-6-hydroxymethyldihydropteridine diphosphokinase [Bacillota bacterium]|jgi:2-amino-4-hydroxy-6-hydroxymethyldihydropteridine diphosphokinase|uniref:2-amino-4-hydroxy-6- hydroxymethyldihydropteridine diphosphokinase n=1 Tax=Bacillus sp. RO2 TaxID=2723913 RepID=UPI00145FC50E|nr:2-amino-4-hydroxy-6-hydroxymethyldihydropteridine diphosphokinase [Bacillus sp. RO2]MEA3319952.1 2-amino-4-hydroxy-6-hydroxymethyldihydropteridine diphosphokinase [Bacillota bacterium]NMH74446.1 2-amino-4-hydroxy-6-hydroxymethyldihydropteridine diphosphokinase [Bacillus sp. RO2]
MNTAYIALGSNQGNRARYLQDAVDKIHQHDKIIVEKESSIYETDPVGYTEQDKFLNMVIKVKTHLTSVDLLKVLQGFEHLFGRKREVRWGPRTLDLDILLYNQENIETEELIIPHPRMWERAFVFVPLMEIAENNDLPIEIDRKELLAQQDREGVHVWKPRSGEDVSGLTES